MCAIYFLIQNCSLVYILVSLSSWCILMYAFFSTSYLKLCIAEESCTFDFECWFGNCHKTSGVCTCDQGWTKDDSGICRSKYDYCFREYHHILSIDVITGMYRCVIMIMNLYDPCNRRMQVTEDALKVQPSCPPSPRIILVFCVFNPVFSRIICYFPLYSKSPTLGLKKTWEVATSNDPGGIF